MNTKRAPNRQDLVQTIRRAEGRPANKQLRAEAREARRLLAEMDRRAAALVVDQWYDRSSRAWITAAKDRRGYQVGDALIDGTRADAAASARYLRSMIDSGGLVPSASES
jgi:hypothetical protein